MNTCEMSDQDYAKQIKWHQAAWTLGVVIVFSCVLLFELISSHHPTQSKSSEPEQGQRP